MLAAGVVPAADLNGIPCNVFCARPPEVPARRALTQQGIGVCWADGTGGFGCSGAGLRSVRLRAPLELPRLREAVERLAAGPDGGVLVVEGSPLAPAVLNAARDIAALLEV